MELSDSLDERAMEKEGIRRLVGGWEQEVEGAVGISAVTGVEGKQRRRRTATTTTTTRVGEKSPRRDEQALPYMERITLLCCNDGHRIEMGRGGQGKGGKAEWRRRRRW